MDRQTKERYLRMLEVDELPDDLEILHNRIDRLMRLGGGRGLNSANELALVFALNELSLKLPPSEPPPPGSTLTVPLPVVDEPESNGDASTDNWLKEDEGKAVRVPWNDPSTPDKPYPAGDGIYMGKGKKGSLKVAVSGDHKKWREFPAEEVTLVD